ncbi:MAG TPA: hypothetical protein VNT58_04040 [Gaiellaceae bacterium]|nr:hypothetical protein [Gaiellaceae bacterium]
MLTHATYHAARTKGPERRSGRSARRISLAARAAQRDRRARRGR